MNAHEQKIEGDVFGIRWAIWNILNFELSELRKENLSLKEQIKTLKNERSSNTRTNGAGWYNETPEE